MAHAGESAILLVGSTEFMNGTRDTYPAFTNITSNLCYENGYFGKQTAAYFKSISYRTNLVNNVFFNSPRSLVNYNDVREFGMMGTPIGTPPPVDSGRPTLSEIHSAPPGFDGLRLLSLAAQAFRGGDLMEGNVLFGAVKETADHASFNSRCGWHHGSICFSSVLFLAWKSVS